MNLNGPNIGFLEYDGFFVQSVKETYGAPIKFRVMSDEELDKILEKGAVIYRKLNPREASGFFDSAMGWAVLAVAAVITYGAVAGALGATASTASAAASGAAAGGSAAGAAGAATATAVSTATAGTGLTTGAVWGAVKTAAPWVGKAAGIYGAVTGDSDAAKVAKAANAVGESKGLMDLAGNLGEFYLNGKKIELKTEAAKKAFVEKVRRKQKELTEYALRQKAIADYYKNLREHGYMKPQKTEIPPWIFLAIPAGIFVMSEIN